MVDEKQRESGKSRRGVVIGVAAVASVLVLAALVFGARYLPVPVKIDGQTRTAPLGSTVAGLRADGLVRVRDGDLLAAKDKRVLRKGGGTALVITVDGKAAGPRTTVWPWTALTSRSGTDVVESIVTTRVAVPIESTFVGKGPAIYMTQPGSVGLKEIRKGEVSGDVVGHSMLIKAVPAVFLRTTPGAANGRVIALTFDDGPWKGTTQGVLAVLRKFKVKATFFMVGQQVRANPALVKAVAKEGHQLGSHSYTHKDLGKAAQKTVAYEIQAGQQAVHRATNTWPRWFRPPYGSVSKTVYAEAGAAKVRLVLWDVDPEDWRRPAATIIANRVINAAKPGAVVLMHDGGGNRKNTVDALMVIIPRLQAQGYRFVTMDQLFAAKAAAKAKPKAKVAAKTPVKPAAAKKP